MDLSQLESINAAEEGAELELRSPVDGSPLFNDETGEPWTIRVLGMDSSRYQDVRHKLANRRLQKRGRGGIKMTAQEIEAGDLELICEITLGWSGITLNKEPFEFTKPNVRQLYTNWPWIREQVEEFIADRANFLGESSKSSKPMRA